MTLPPTTSIEMNLWKGYRKTLDSSGFFLRLTSTSPHTHPSPPPNAAFPTCPPQPDPESLPQRAQRAQWRFRLGHGGGEGQRRDPYLYAEDSWEIRFLQTKAVAENSSDVTEARPKRRPPSGVASRQWLPSSQIFV